MIFTIDTRILGRPVKFQMDLDPARVADSAMHHYIERGEPPEPEVCFVMVRALREGDLAVDGGANIGFFTLLMASLVGPSGRVIAVEPDQSNQVALVQNIALNGFRNIEIVRRPLWSAPEHILFHCCRDSGESSVAPSEHCQGVLRSETVQAITLNEVCLEHGEKPRLIKLDLEGCEYRALAGLPVTQNALIVSEINEAALERVGSSVEAIRKLLRGPNMDCFLLDRAGSIPSFVPPQVKINPKRENCNVLFAKLYQVAELWPEVDVL